MESLCSPALIYVIFSSVQILFDFMNNMINTAIMKIVVVIMITFLLQVLCDRGLNTVAWLIVFIPFIFMSVIIGFLLYIFGLNPQKGTLNFPNGVSTDSNGNVVVYNPSYNPKINPVKYQTPNIIVPTPNSQPPPQPYKETKIFTSTNTPINGAIVVNVPPSSISSSPSYQ